MPIHPMIAAAGLQAVGGGIGLGIDAIKQEQQIKQAKRLQKLQMAGQKEMAQYNTELGKDAAMDMWNKTNYGAQRKHMEAAGLNVGLMYGMGGGGGATTQTSAEQGNVQGQAAYVGESAGMGIQMGQQLALQAAQIKLIEAQAEKTKVETTKTAGVDTESVVLDNRTKAIQAQVNEATKWDQVVKIAEDARTSTITADMGAKQSAIQTATQEAQIETIRKEAILKGVEIKAKEAQTNLTNVEIQETTEKINKIVAEVSRMEAQTEQGKEALILERMQKEFNTSTPAQIKQWTDIGTDIMKATKLGGLNGIKK